MRKIKEILGIAFCILFLAGCSGRELEDREFPTAVTVPTGDMERLQAVRQDESRKYLDYSHVKAVIFHEDVINDRGKLVQALDYFESRPEFARNLLVFVGGDEELKIASGQKDKIGLELQDYYKNQPKGAGRDEVTMMELWSYCYNQETAIVLPRVKAAGEKLWPEGSEELARNE